MSRNTTPATPLAGTHMDSTTTPDIPAPPRLDRALDLVRFLRAHCEWDAAQTPRSLVKHLLEEAHEVVDAIHDDDASQLEGELGDLLLNLAFQIVIAEERGGFTAEAVVAGLEAKIRRRHPHLYGDGARQDWSSLKAKERGGTTGALDGIPRGLDAAHKAHQLQERAASVGFDWPTIDGALAKLDEELTEVRQALSGGDEERIAGELGDLMFSVVNVTRVAGHHAADVLERTNREFERRFRSMEKAAAALKTPFADLDLSAMEALWQRAKRERAPD